MGCVECILLVVITRLTIRMLTLYREIGRRRRKSVEAGQGGHRGSKEAGQGGLENQERWFILMGKTILPSQLASLSERVFQGACLRGVSSTLVTNGPNQ